LTEAFSISSQDSLGSSGPESNPNNKNKHNTTSSTPAFEFVEPAWLEAGYGGPLPEYDHGLSSDPWSSQLAPAGQVDGVHGEDSSSTAQFDLEPHRLDHSLQSDTLQSNSLPQETDASSAVTDIVATESATVLQCEECFEIFSKRYLLKYNSRSIGASFDLLTGYSKHMKKHFPPFQCDDCDMAFRYSKDLKRHCKSQHPETVEGQTVLFCPYLGCKFSAERSSGSTRRDNLNRHIQTQHGS
jgi:hypothetical protein